MPRQLDEPITVTLAPEGEPQAFVWRRFEYEIVGVPQAFFRRRAWWREREPSLRRIDGEFWRVEATPTGDIADAHTYDITTSGPDEEGWRLTLEWE